MADEESDIAVAPEQSAVPPAPTRAPLPSVSEQMHRWEQPGQNQGGGYYTPDDLQDYNNELLKWAGQSRSSQEFNAKLAATREAAQAATEFVRRKEVESLVRGGMPLEDAEFRSRVKYNTASGGQLNALRPVRTPTAMEIGGIEGVTTGRGDQWKPFPAKPAPKPTPEQASAVQFHSKLRDEGIKMYRAILSEQQRAAAAKGDDTPEGKARYQESVSHLETMFPQYENLRTLIGKSRESAYGPKTNGAPTPPKIGEIRKKHRYKGGNPADKNSWELVK